MEKTLVIIPTYNEAENIKKVIEATIREKKFDVLVVDDSSPDGTATIVKEIIKSYPKKVFLEVKKIKMDWVEHIFMDLNGLWIKCMIIFSKWMQIFLIIQVNLLQCLIT